MGNFKVAGIPLVAYFVAMTLLGEVASDRILFLLPLSTKSHKNFFDPLISSLAKRGHKVTVLTNERSLDERWRNNLTVTELAPVSSQELMKGFPNPFEYKKNGKSMAFPFHFVISGCHKVIQSEIFQNLMIVNSPQRNFDLIIVDSFLSNCFDGFIHKSGVPFILATTTPAPSYISERVGNFLPPSIIPVISFDGYGENNGEMSFVGRLRNFMHFCIAKVYVQWKIIPTLEKVYREYLGDETPGIFEIEQGAKMIFTNSHYSMNFPRPMLPAIVELGGIHCRKPAKLKNTELATFVSKSSSPTGFIYFSIGSIIKTSYAPAHLIQALFSAFSKLSQRVVVKWSSEVFLQTNSSLSHLEIPSNVWVDDWFSQQDVLGHENIRLFISHGGLLSMQEAVYHSVPVIGLPFGMDQNANIHNAVLQGFALQLDYSQLDEPALTAAIQKMLNDSSFKRNVQRISKAFRHRQSTPLDTAVFWTEHVLNTIRDNATDLIQSPARKMSIFQYYSFDIFIFLAVICMLVAAIFAKTVKQVLNFFKTLVVVVVVNRSTKLVKYQKLH